MPAAMAPQGLAQAGGGRRREEADIGAPHVRIHITAQSTCHISF